MVSLYSKEGMKSLWKWMVLMLTCGNTSFEKHKYEWTQQKPYPAILDNAIPGIPGHTEFHSVWPLEKVISYKKLNIEGDKHSYQAPFDPPSPQTIELNRVCVSNCRMLSDDVTLVGIALCSLCIGL